MRAQEQSAFIDGDFDEKASSTTEIFAARSAADFTLKALN